MNRFSDWRYWRNLFIFSLGVVILGALFVLIRFGYQGAQSYAHPHRYQREMGDDPSQFDVQFQSTTLMTEDGIELSAWYTPSQNEAIILVAHGYGGVRSALRHSFFAWHGYGVISWDARAHGVSGGDLVTWGYYERADVKAALDYALSIDPDLKVGAFGESMGAATVLLAAAEQPQIQAVIADSAFAAIGDMIHIVSPYPIFRPFIQFFAERETGLKVDSLRPVDAIQHISPRPVFIIQGQADQTVPPDSAQHLFDAAGEPKILWTEPDIGHVGMLTAFPDVYDERVIAFFDQYLLEE